MIWGINFGGDPIPDTIRRRFRARVKPANARRGEYVYLVGVAQSPAEREAMLAIAQHGVRAVHVETRATAAGPWYGIYT